MMIPPIRRAIEIRRSSQIKYRGILRVGKRRVLINELPSGEFSMKSCFICVLWNQALRPIKKAGTRNKSAAAVKTSTGIQRSLPAIWISKAKSSTPASVVQIRPGEKRAFVFIAAGFLMCLRLAAGVCDGRLPRRSVRMTLSAASSSGEHSSALLRVQMASSSCVSLALNCV